jgi:predicted DNA-binding transcriptional regulator AlpA
MAYIYPMAHDFNSPSAIFDRLIRSNRPGYNPDDIQVVYVPVEASAPDAPPRKLISVGTVATMIGVSERSVWRLASAGEIPRPRKLGHRRLWRVADIELFITDAE